MPDTMSAELQAMVQIEVALKSLQDDERSRVIQWALARFRVQAKAPQQPVGAKTAAGNDASSGTEGFGATNGADNYEELATFYDAAGPSTDTDKALVVAYWIQVREGAADIDTQSVNTRLKHLGYGIGNVTRAFDGLKSQKPALTVQLRKEGSTQQARKRFKVTSEGKKAVERMLSAGE
ncbi:MAG: hypothetical protein JSR56_04870 [Proteobacteria bacterium]|nr:hypothetical protein [Pseudomonadota bacterium]